MLLSHNVVIEWIGGLGLLASTGMDLMWGAEKKFIHIVDFTLIVLPLENHRKYYSLLSLVIQFKMASSLIRGFLRKQGYNKKSETPFSNFLTCNTILPI